MAGLSSVLNADLSGLQAYREALQAVAENTSNATTPGYGRRSVDMASQISGPDQVVGNGVQVSSVTRAASAFADARYRAALSSQGSANTLVQALTTLQSNFSTSTGISASLTQFFSDAMNLSSQPQNLPARQTLMSDGQQLTAAFNTVAGNIQGNRNNLDQQASDLTGRVNQLLTQLASINQQIRTRGGSDINSLLDNQQAALQSLSKLVGVNVIRYSNGAIRLSNNGQVLLDSSGATTLTEQSTVTASNPTGAPQIVLPNGHVMDPKTLSGQLGGVLTAASQAQSILQGVNRMAAVTAALINGQQALGLTPSGTQGGPLFSVPPATVTAQPANTGSAALSALVTNATQLPSNGGPFMLKYNGTQWTAVNQGDGKTQTLGAGPTLSFSGISVSVSGTANAGDQFLVNPVNGAAAGMSMTTSDPGAIATAVPYVQTPGTISASGGVTDNNAGTGQVSAGSVVSSPSTGALVVPAADYGSTLQLVFTSPTAYQVQTTGGTVIASGSYSPSSGGAVAFAYPGSAGGQYWQMNVSGSPATGDTFTLSPGGPASGGNVDALGQLATAPLLNGNTLNDAWSNITGNVGAAVNSANTSQTNANTAVKGTQAAVSAVSGVSLDQQAGQLQLYQQAYQASAKSIAIVNQLFQGLLNAA